MKVISLLNHKGGVGKTTLCTNIGKGLQLLDESSNILLVDADQQGSLRDWHDASDGMAGINVIGADRRQMLLQSKSIALSLKTNYMIIDTPGDMKEIHGAAISISDLIIIPIRPSPYDIWATLDTIDLIKTSMAANAKLKAIFVINQAIQNSTITNDVIGALNMHPEIYLAYKYICHRVAFAKCVNLGGTIYDSKDASAIREMHALVKYIFDLLWGNNEQYNA